MSPLDILYMVSIIGLSFIVYLWGISLDVLTTTNGAIIGFFYILAIPILMHLKCVYYDRSSGQIEGD